MQFLAKYVIYKSVSRRDLFLLPTSNKRKRKSEMFLWLLSVVAAHGASGSASTSGLSFVNWIQNLVDARDDLNFDGGEDSTDGSNSNFIRDVTWPRNLEDTQVFEQGILN
jgi:hypothetical protein